MKQNVQKNNHSVSLSYSSDEVKILEKKAKTLITSLTGSFVLEAKDFLEEMGLILQEAQEIEKADRTVLFKKRFFQLAHDLKGQGSTYGFELITILSEHICDVIRHKNVFSQKEIDLFLQDVDDMKRVLSLPPHAVTSSLKKEIITRLEKLKCLR